jgi:hypothetical protein
MDSEGADMGGRRQGSAPRAAANTVSGSRCPE